MEHTLHQALSSIDHEEGQLEQEEQQLGLPTRIIPTRTIRVF